jgi:hypothetical protein
MSHTTRKYVPSAAFVNRNASALARIRNPACGAVVICLLLFSSVRVTWAEGDFSNQVAALQAQVGKITIGPISARQELNQRVSELAGLGGSIDEREKTISTNEAQLKSIQSEAESAKASAEQMRPQLERDTADIQAEAQAVDSSAQTFNSECGGHRFQLPTEQAAYDACAARKSQLESRQQAVLSRASALKNVTAQYDSARSSAAAKEEAAKRAADELAELKQTQESDKARFQSGFNFASKAYQQLVAIEGAARNVPDTIDGPNAKPGNVGFDTAIATKSGGSSAVGAQGVVGTTKGERGAVDARGVAGTQLPRDDPLVVKHNEAKEALKRIEQNKQADPAELKRAVDAYTNTGGDMLWKRYQERLKKGTVDTTVNAGELSK